MIAGLILAGGRGVRIGGNKPGVMLAGKPLLHWSMRALQQVVPHIVVAIAPGQELPHVCTKVPVTVCEDLLPGRGPLTGVFTGLRCSEAERILVAPCDAPLVQPDVLRMLLARRSRVDAVIPRVNGRLETAFGVYAESALPVLTEALNSDDLSMRSLVSRLDVEIVEEDELRAVDPDLLTFMNVNTHDDLERVALLLAEEQQRSA